MPPAVVASKDTYAIYPPALGDRIDQGATFWLNLAIAFGTADAATLYTVPADRRMCIHRACWQADVSFTGGASSAIGVSSDATGFTTKGDILGGATGDVLATLAANANPIGGTIGAKFGSNGMVVLPAGKLVRFDRITSAFTAGSGYVLLHCSWMPTS